ncbi:MAG: VOC family protein [Aureispira sp.]
MKSIQQSIAHINLLVQDYDDAIAFYTQQVGFELLEDTALGNGKRWVRIAPPNSIGTALLLSKVTKEEQLQQVGHQAGGKVLLFLQTNDFWRDYQRMKQANVHFLEAPREETYATVVVFEDLYGNQWDLLEPK